MDENNQIPPEEKREDNFKIEEPVFTTMAPHFAAFAALIGIFLLYQFGGAVLTLLLFGFDIEKADVNAVRLLTTGGQILLMLLPTLLIAKMVYQDNITFALRAKFPSWKEIGIFLIGFIILMPLLQNFIYLQNYGIELLNSASPAFKKLTTVLDGLDQVVEKSYAHLLQVNSFFEGSFVVFVVAVVPALCEETLFRGFVQKSFEQKYSPFISIMITSLFFGFYHFSPYGLLALISLGIYFGYAAYKSDSIFVAMFLHFINNFLAVMAFIIIGDQDLISAKAEAKDDILPAVIGFIILSIIFASFIYWVQKNYFTHIKKGGQNDLSKV